MTVKEFADAVLKSPGLWKEPLFIVTDAERVTEGELDGGVRITSKPLQSVTLGLTGVWLFVDAEAEARVAVQLETLPKQIAGPTPDALKHLATIHVE